MNYDKCLAVMIALTAWVVALFPTTNAHVAVVVIPAMPSYAPTDFSCGETVCNCYENNCGNSCDCWVCYEDEAWTEYRDAFTALFNSYETKTAKNGRIMIRRGNTGSFKFAKMGV